jgi:hypothetical protein
MTRSVYGSDEIRGKEMGWRRKGGRECQIDEVTNVPDVIFEGNKSQVKIDFPTSDSCKYTRTLRQS